MDVSLAEEMISEIKWNQSYKELSEERNCNLNSTGRKEREMKEIERGSLRYQMGGFLQQ